MATDIIARGMASKSNINVETHTNNNDIHVTASDKSNWNNKLDKNQGSENSGKVLGTNANGEVIPLNGYGFEYDEETKMLKYGTDPTSNLNQGIGLDDTLSKRGYAADAGAVGELKEDLGYEKTTIYPVNRLNMNAVTVAENRIMPNGSLTPTSGTKFMTTDFIPVKTNDVVCVFVTTSPNPANFRSLCCYDKNKKVVVGGVNANTAYFTVPDGVWFIKLSVGYVPYFHDYGMIVVDGQVRDTFSEYFEPYDVVKFKNIEANYQTKTDDTLTTTSKEVVGAINENASNITELREDFKNIEANRTKIIENTKVINSVENRVINTQIETVTGTRNASTYGVLPSETATVNRTKLQELLDIGGTIVIDVPGVYDIDGTLYIGSDTELICGKGVKIRKTATTGGVIINKGALSKEYDTNITIRGLNIVCNEKAGSSINYVTGLRGQVAFYYVKNLIISEFECLDIPASTYCIHLAKWENVLIENSIFKGKKDGIHMNCGNGMTIKHCSFTTGDDPIALNAHDYITGVPEYGWIENVLVEDCTDNGNGNNNGRTALFLGGAWMDWASGNEYKFSDTIVSENGYVYRLVGESKTSTVCPTHDNGDVEYSDGCIWRFIQDTPIYNVGCRNVVFRNIYVNATRTACFVFHYDDDDVYSRSYYPHSVAVHQKNFTFENIILSKDANTVRLLMLETPVDLIRVFNSYLKCTTLVKATEKVWDSLQSNKKCNIIITGNSVVADILFEMNKDYDFTITARDNIKSKSLYNIISDGTVTVKENDLTQ